MATVYPYDDEILNITEEKVVDKIKCKFEMTLWQRIKAVCIVWWAIVVTKELTCIDDGEDNGRGRD